jgi:uncharacterized membrane protein
VSGTDTNTSKWRVYVAIVAAVVLVSALIITAPAIKRQLNAWKLLPQPERLTELYFTSPNQLPASYTPGQPQTVSFTAHNLEYRTTNYTYQISEQNQAGSATQPLAAGSFVLGQNQYHTQAVRIPLANLGSRVKVEVALTNVNESIDYWVEAN